jgi:hypothetical protein
MEVYLSNVVIHCSDVLKFKPDSIKGLYYRAKAHVMLGELEAAKVDMKVALGIEPGNKVVREL